MREEELLEVIKDPARRMASTAHAAWPKHVGRSYPKGRHPLCNPQMHKECVSFLHPLLQKAPSLPPGPAVIQRWGPDPHHVEVPAGGLTAACQHAEGEARDGGGMG